MYYLKTESSFDSAHFLKGYNGKCRNLHGHRWRVVVEIAADQLKDEGQTREMLVDFSDLKSCNLFTDEIGHFFLKIVCLWYTSIIHFR